MKIFQWLVFWNNISINVRNLHKMKFLRFQKKKEILGICFRGFQKWIYLRELIFAAHKESVYFNLTLINDKKVIFFAENHNFALKSHICLIIHTLRRPYSRPLLGATIASNLVSWILKNMFSLEMVKRCALQICTHVPNT